VLLKRRDKHTIQGRCSCPAYADFGPCKHIAATGFAAIAHDETEGYHPNETLVETLEEASELERLGSVDI
jgi:uncharacterized Zn finger protein